MAKTKAKYYVRTDGLHESIRTINGKRVAFRGKTDREVDRKILEYREDAALGRMFRDVADDWERGHEAAISASTRRVYSYAVKRLKAAWDSKRVSALRPLDVQRYFTAFEKEGHSVNTVQIELTVCRMIFAHAVLYGDMDVNPAAEIRCSRGLPAKKREALTEEQEKRVKACTVEPRGEGWLLGLLLLYTGLRRGEALALSYSDIDRKNKCIHITKKLSYVATQQPKLEDWLKSENGRRDVPLLPPLAEALPKNRVGLIFPGKDGGFMRASELRSVWRKFCRDAGLNSFEYLDGKAVETFPVTPHCFRHSFATICYEAGIDPRQAAQMLGDTPDVLERVYTHLRDAHRATAAEKLEAYFAIQQQIGEG